MGHILCVCVCVSQLVNDGVPHKHLWACSQPQRRSRLIGPDSLP